MNRDNLITNEMLDALSNHECLVLNACLECKNYSHVAIVLNITLAKAQWDIRTVCKKLNIYPISVQKIKLVWELSVIENRNYRALPRGTYI